MLVGGDAGVELAGGRGEHADLDAGVGLSEPVHHRGHGVLGDRGVQGELLRRVVRGGRRGGGRGGGTAGGQAGQQDQQRGRDGRGKPHDDLRAGGAASGRWGRRIQPGRGGAPWPTVLFVRGPVVRAPVVTGPFVTVLFVTVRFVTGPFGLR